MRHSVGAISANLPVVVRVLRMEHAALARDKTGEPQGRAALHAQCRGKVEGIKLSTWVLLNSNLLCSSRQQIVNCL